MTASQKRFTPTRIAATGARRAGKPHTVITWPEYAARPEHRSLRSFNAELQATHWPGAVSNKSKVNH